MATTTSSINYLSLLISIYSTDYPSWYKPTGDYKDVDYDAIIDSNLNYSKSYSDLPPDDQMDHIDFFGLKLLVFDYFEKNLADLEGFEGFSPRWTLITKLRNTSSSLYNTSSLLLIIVKHLFIIKISGFQIRS